MWRRIWIGSGVLVLFTSASAAGLFPGQKFPAGDGPGFVAAGDFDGDGRQDLVTANAYSRDITVLLGNDDGTFAPAIHYAAGDGPGFVAVGDFDGDGQQDLVATNARSDEVAVLLGNGDGTFAPAVDSFAGDDPGSVAVGDFDADGQQDLGETLGGQPIAGSDSITTAGCRGFGQPSIWLKDEERLSQPGRGRVVDVEQD